MLTAYVDCRSEKKDAIINTNQTCNKNCQIQLKLKSMLQWVLIFSTNQMISNRITDKKKFKS